MPDQEIGIGQAEIESRTEKADLSTPMQAMPDEQNAPERSAAEKQADRKKDLEDRIDQRNDRKKL